MLAFIQMNNYMACISMQIIAKIFITFFTLA